MHTHDRHRQGSARVPPWVSIRFTAVPGRSCISGPDDSVRLPPCGQNIDWKIEPVAVIGRPAKNAAPEPALEHVAANAIGNDVSARDHRYLGTLQYVSPNTYVCQS